MKYEDIERDRPFRIAKLNRKGKIADRSLFKIDGKDNILRVYFEYEKFWINAPDNRTLSKWIRAIEKWGILYDK